MSPDTPQHIEDPEADEPADVGPPRDPWVGWLVTASLMLLVVVLAGTTALIFYLLSMRGAPRTADERRVARAEAAVEESPESATDWAELAYAYAAAERYGAAFDAVSDARAVTGSPSFDLIEADLLRLTGKFEEAVEAYDRAEQSAVEMFDRSREAAAEEGIMMVRPNELLGAVLRGRAMTLQELGELDRAVDDAEGAVEIEPMSATNLTLLGDILAAAGQHEKAAEAYQEALRFVPDHQAALDGLADLDLEGGEQ